ncbi:MAG: MOSC domain-containing protein [Actinobacteria bacterium]|nr:MOSC domain-containing protein [Actinomycetota bacterium]
MAERVAGSGKVISVNVSETAGVRKSEVGSCLLIEGRGLSGDAHAGDWHRQVSLLAVESVDKMRDRGLDVGPGDFGENLTTQGTELVSLPVGTRMRVGEEVLLEVSQIGKECTEPCAIYYQAGDCVMPREGIFAVVVEGGRVSIGDDIVVC